MEADVGRSKNDEDGDSIHTSDEDFLDDEIEMIESSDDDEENIETSEDETSEDSHNSNDLVQDESDGSRIDSSKRKNNLPDLGNYEKKPKLTKEPKDIIENDDDEKIEDTESNENGFNEDMVNYVTKKVVERTGGKKILFHPQYKDSSSGGISGKITPESRRQYFDESFQPRFIPRFNKFLTSKEVIYWYD